MAQEDNTLRQKKIAFANGVDLPTLLTILKECSQSSDGLVGKTEYETVVNAVTLDAKAQLIMDFIKTIDRIKRGELLTTESNG